ncbi:MAG: ribonuclease P protein component [Rhodospirillaceae bacterium]|nr:ribonuclease P protein component [Rhodospirillaceae bacterium]
MGRQWHRLKRRSDFLSIAANGARRATPAFVLQARALPEADGAAPILRIGFTASRKVGNAVARNRAKRRLRALCDRVLGDRMAPGRALSGWDLVVIARDQAVSRDFAAMTAEFEQAFGRVTAPGSQRGRS